MSPEACTSAKWPRTVIMPRCLTANSTWVCIGSNCQTPMSSLLNHTLAVLDPEYRTSREKSDRSQEARAQAAPCWWVPACSWALGGAFISASMVGPPDRTNPTSKMATSIRNTMLRKVV